MVEYSVTPVGTPATIPDFSAGLFGTGELLGTGDIVAVWSGYIPIQITLAISEMSFCGNGRDGLCRSQVIGWWDQTTPEGHSYSLQTAPIIFP
jgi:hypothetical protein